MSDDPSGSSARVVSWAAAGAAGVAALLAGGPLRAAELPDPTRPPGVDRPGLASTEPERVTDFALTAVFFSEGRRVAIINGTRLREGDAIGAAVVESIDAGRVRLARDGGSLDLVLLPFQVKQGARAGRTDEAAGRLDLRPVLSIPATSADSTPSAEEADTVETPSSPASMPQARDAGPAPGQEGKAE